MNTWKEAPPPQLPPLGRVQKIRAGARTAAIVALTLVSLGLFLTGRFLRGFLGRWVTFHFGVAWVWARLCLRLCGLKLVIKGAPIASGALVSNHSSWIDIVALRAVQLMYFVSKAEVANWPGVGFITKVTGTVFIERRRSQAKRQEEILRERIGADQLLCFFPEGTSTDGLRVLDFKSSLFSAFFADGAGTDIPIQPVTLRYRVRDDVDLPDNFYGWWGSMGFESHIWEIFGRSSGGVAEVIFHSPVNAADFADRKRLADHCGRAVKAGRDKGTPITIALPEQSLGSAEND